MKRPAIRSAVVGALLFLSSCHSYRAPGLRIIFKNNERPQPHRSLNRAPAPGAIADMDCLFVNISGENIKPEQTLSGVTSAEQTCMKLGSVSELVTLSNNQPVNFSLSTLSGKARRVQVIGVVTKDVIGCQGKRTLAELFQNGKPYLYEVGATTADIAEGSVVSINSNYSPATAIDLMPACTTSPAAPAPTVTGVSPSAGPLAGGTTLTITGTNFLARPKVDIGGVACASITVTSATALQCVTVANSAGPKSVILTNGDGQVGTLPSGFAYQSAPTVTSVSPNGGLPSGGTPVTITGTGFVAGAAVDFGGSACGSVVVSSPTSLTCTTSAHIAGAVTVTVTNADTQSGFSASAYTYRVAPTVTSVSPNGGLPSGATLVTITGTGFVAGALADFGGSTCGFLTVNSPTSITCTTSSHSPGAVTVTVTNPDTQFGSLANAYTYRAAPTVTSVSPNGGLPTGSTAVTITGTGFVAGATVDFGGSPCGSVVVASATSISCTTSSHLAGAVTVTVTNPDLQSGFLAGAYTYRLAPTVTSVSPNGGLPAGGTPVTITGTGFVAGASVDFQGSACGSVIVVSSTSITCTTTSHSAGPVTVTVTNTDTQMGFLGSAYTYRAAPTVSNVSPNGGLPGGATPVTITGTGFIAGATVDFGGSPCGSVIVVSSTSITCTTSPHLAGAVNVTVTNTDTQSGFLGGGYTYRAAPTVTGVTPNGGLPAGATPVTVNGSGFVAGATVDFGGSPCTPAVVNNSNSITCATTAHSPGPVPVTVTNADTQSGFLGGAYTYQAAPTVINVTPNGGLPSGLTPVTITGSGFVNGATVDFGGSPCNLVIVNSPTTINCTTSSHLAGPVTVTVTNPDTQSGFLGSAYTYRPAPTVTQVSPNGGNTLGGTLVTITGTGFVSGAAVDFGGATCSSVSVNSPINITCTTTAHLASTVGVTVTNPDNQNGSLGGAYTFQNPPTVTSVSPPTITPFTTPSLTISGTGFLAMATVTIRGQPCTPVMVVSPTTITCNSPSLGNGQATLIVQNTDGQSVTKTNYLTVGASDFWASMVGPGGVRESATGVWSGTELLMWGGFDGSVVTNQGSRYNPNTDSWTAISTTMAPTLRKFHTAVWTGTDMIVFGGTSGSSPTMTGGKYNPIGNSWTQTSTSGAPTARYNHVAVWTGSKMIVWGGQNGLGTYFNTGGVYDPMADSWTMMSTSNAPSAREFHTAVWTGSKMFVWGGSDASNFYNTGALYDPNTDSWTTTDAISAPTARKEHSMVWTGTKAIVFGGVDSGAVTLLTGGQYDPTLDTWTATQTSGAAQRTQHTAVWTGTKMLMWGGLYGSYISTGYQYDPVGNSWSAMSASPTGRAKHIAAWTGAQMIVWGGYNGTTIGNGGKYTP